MPEYPIATARMPNLEDVGTVIDNVSIVSNLHINNEFAAKAVWIVSSDVFVEAENEYQMLAIVFYEAPQEDGTIRIVAGKAVINTVVCVADVDRVASLPRMDEFLIHTITMNQIYPGATVITAFDGYLYATVNDSGRLLINLR